MLSAAIFSPQSSPPPTTHLAYVRVRLREDPRLKSLRDAVVQLPETWQALASSGQGISLPDAAIRALHSFPRWIENGESDVLECDMSGIVTLPLLTIIHIVQYLCYLEATGLTHSEFLRSVELGGVQGYCIGLLSAVIVASSKNEQEVVQHAVTGICIALGIGAFGDLNQVWSASGSTSGSNTLQISLRKPNDVDEMLRKFPAAIVSTITEPRTMCIIAPEGDICALKDDADKQRLRPKWMHIRSNLHNPENAALAQQCFELFDQAPFPTSDLLQVPVRSNRTGELLVKGNHSLGRELIITVLASQCNWSQVIQSLVLDLQQSGEKRHTLAVFGIGDPISVPFFQQLGLEVSKVHALSGMHTFQAPDVAPSTADHYPDDAIAIVGAACRLPGAGSLDELWDIVSQGQSRLEKLNIDRVDLKGSYRAHQDAAWAKQEFYGNFVDNVKGFDNSFFGISPREATHMDPQQRLLLETAFEAMDSSGYLRHHRRDRGDPVGCFIGASYTEYLENTSAYLHSAFTATGTIRAFLSGKISYHFGWTGPSEVIDTACSASLVAVHRACRAISAGECPLALAGGVNIITGVNNYFDLAKAGFLSKTGQCKPFDDSADGYCRADGVGLVVLKSLRKAVSDGDLIMGVIPSVATNQGGIGAPGITVPDGVCQVALYKTLLQRSGIEADRVSYVEAHGTGTQVGDPIEISSIRDVFGGRERTNPLYIGSLKANIGHSETAAGVASLLKVLTMLRHRAIPPLQGFKRLNHKIPPLDDDRMCIPARLVPWNAASRIACVNSYGASGSNSALLCAEWQEENSHKPAGDITPAVQEYPILLSAASVESLQRYAKALATYLTKQTTEFDLGNLSYTLSERRKHHRVRFSTTAADPAGLIRQLQACGPQDLAVSPKSVRKAVLVFSGQSKTTIALEPSVRQQNPRFEHYIQACNDVLRSLGGPDILPALSQAEPISDPTVLQCGTVAVQYACAQCWIDGGLEVAGIVGHSLGELTALAVSGVLSLQDMLKVVLTRAELINAHWGPERGTMMAVHADLETVRAILDVVNTRVADPDEALEIACYNSMTSHVIVGKEASVAAAEKIIKQHAEYQGLRCQRLTVSHGFHSRFTEPLLQGLSELERTLHFKEPAVPLETSTRQQVMFGNGSPTRYLANHARDPVFFVDAVRRLEQRLGFCVWMEAGWATPIVAMSKRAVASPEKHSFHPVTSVAAAVSELWREGIATAHWSFLTPRESCLRPIYLPPYSFDHPEYWLAHVDRAMEERETARSMTDGSTSTPKRHKTKQLVEHTSSIGTLYQFRLHTGTERFTRIVQGHAVRQKPLCPASMYMEAALMGVEQLGVSNRSKTIKFKDVMFDRPLGCDSSLDVQLVLDEPSGAESSWWHYVVRSSPGQAHSRGAFSASSQENDDFQLYEMLLADKVDSLKRDPDAERLKTTTAYSIFSKVVNYASLLQGISSIILSQRQSLAQIKVPKTIFAASESTVAEFYDAITLDTFIQVLGLLVNSNAGSSSDDEIYVASSIGKMVVSPTQFLEPQAWTVYATYSVVDHKTCSGAVFAFSEDGKLRTFATGICFVRIQAARLERVLKAASPDASVPRTADALPPSSSGASLPEPTIHRQTTVHDTMPISSSARRVASEFRGADETSTKIKELRSLLSDYTGVPLSELESEQSLSDIGLDSLGSMELADEIESKLGLSIQTEDLLMGTVGSLVKLLQFSKTAPATPDADAYNETPDSSEARSYVASQHTTDASAPRPGDPHSNLWTRPKPALSSRFRLETAVYKEVDGLDILADLYIPTEVPFQPMTIALVIHGGGHLTLSRKAVRPAQIKHLLANGILPVSVDYRLCPQVNVIDGPVADVRDACIWIQGKLPGVMAAKGIEIDPSRYVVIGWSTGGTLAMTTAWTLRQAGMQPPSAILAFYCPVEYDPEAPTTMGYDIEQRTMSLGQIRELLSDAPTAGHAPNSLDATRLGWVKRGDPRSELVRALVKEERGMSLLFNGLPRDGDELPYPDADRANAFSPLSQVREGNYRTPTYLIFGDQDEIAPFDKGAEFAQALEDQGVRGGFLPVRGARHIFDLGLAPGSEGWDAGVGPGYGFLLEELESAHR
ncbi:polyketide synthase [Colletotrichum musicola]|uniref:Polyketide synthase n=1 Tax=Colletotrichum musicola TaxID=2175873 RepID=A0A8H6NU88_9PEZI|nr:polyketide synthase [Colletotrichum musicola]